MSFAIDNAWLIPLLPLLAAVTVGLFGRKYLRGASHWPVWAAVGASALLSLLLLGDLLGRSHDHASVSIGQTWLGWIDVGTGPVQMGQVLSTDAGRFTATFGAWLDPLSAVMLCVVCGIGFLITVFAAGYMKGDQGYWRFFAYLALFIFSMTCLVMGDNLLMLFLGWEGVGLCSYLLIGYYYQKPSARDAAIKAFIVNRIGDLGFAIGIMLTWYCFGTISYFGEGESKGFLQMALNVAENVPADRQWLVQFIPFALMLGAFGKSAQFPLHVWLPDAMEGPTPVSALIHAATMVTAGVYMIARLSPIFAASEVALTTIAVVGMITALLGGTVALRQFDLKKVFAFSTVSQLGFMIVAVGVLAPVAAVFHLITHAFFKALLFLSSGVVMHATNGELDIRRMSGLGRLLPVTRWLMFIGCAALAGLPVVTAGYWSKDEIIVAAGGASLVLKVLLTITAFITAYYSFRVWFRVFSGPEVIPHATSHGAHAPASKHDHHDEDHRHEPLLMIAPLVLLAAGAVFAGLINLPFAAGVDAHALGHFLGQSPSFSLGSQVALANPELIMSATREQAVLAQFGVGQPEFHVGPLILGGVVALAGMLAAWFMHSHNRKASDTLADRLRGVATILQKQYWIDAIYLRLIVEPLRALGFIISVIDRTVIGGVCDLVGLSPRGLGAVTSLLVQRGYLQGYALTMVIGALAILLVVLI
jgi:NADH-quinone oxidoreductase subunit L